MKTGTQHRTAALGWILGGMVLLVTSGASALELDWSGQFRFEFNSLKNYTLDSSAGGSATDTARLGRGGYYIPGGGSSNADYQTLFLRVRPKIIVNDNIAIKSEWWVGDPVFGLFGNSLPYSRDQQTYYSTFSRGSSITAQRFWGELQTDFGTMQIGRVPLQWGLGVVWNSGDDLWARYMSTGDAVRVMAKFGNFSIIPSFVNYSTGNTIGGACNYSSATGACATKLGSGGAVDYSFIFKYDNKDDEFEGGLNFIKRLTGASQDPNSGFRGPQANSPVAMNYNTWDLYARKKLGKVAIGVELPIVNGTIGPAEYKSYALAGEVDWKINDIWETQFKLGHASGQPNSGSATLSNYKAFFYHPNYHLGMIMFNYQFANFAGPQTLNTQGRTAGTPLNAQESDLSSPNDNPIVNANYLAATAMLHSDKWTFHGTFVFAKANETATDTSNFFNTWSRTVYTKLAAAQNQGSWLGWEMDYGSTFQWDENFVFGLDVGFYFPGSYYAFSNTAVQNKLDMMWGLTGRVGISF